MNITKLISLVHEKQSCQPPMNRSLTEAYNILKASERVVPTGGLVSVPTLVLLPYLCLVVKNNDQKDPITAYQIPYPPYIALKMPTEYLTCRPPLSTPPSKLGRWTGAFSHSWIIILSHVTQAHTHGGGTETETTHKCTCHTHFTNSTHCVEPSVNQPICCRETHNSNTHTPALPICTQQTICRSEILY
jgi:hypothetical protein